MALSSRVGYVSGPSQRARTCAYRVGDLGGAARARIPDSLIIASSFFHELEGNEMRAPTPCHLATLSWPRDHLLFSPTSVSAWICDTASRVTLRIEPSGTSVHASRVMGSDATTIARGPWTVSGTGSSPSQA